MDIGLEGGVAPLLALGRLRTGRSVRFAMDQGMGGPNRNVEKEIEGSNQKPTIDTGESSSFDVTGSIGTRAANNKQLFGEVEEELAGGFVP